MVTVGRIGKKPDVPCADCGKLLYSSATSLPPGLRRCLDCRRANPAPKRRGSLCSVCGEPKTSNGDRPCRKCDGSRPRGVRQCEICGEDYKPTYGAQRTCGRVCGDTLRYGASKHERRPIPKAKATPIAYVNCAGCSRLFVIRARDKRRCCSRLCVAAAIAGTLVRSDRTVRCARCDVDFTAEVVTKPRRYCDGCAATRPEGTAAARQGSTPSAQDGSLRSPRLPQEGLRP